MDKVDISEKQFYYGFHKKEFPLEYMFITLIMVYLKDDIFRCTGSLIQRDWVITAAHCLTHKKITVRDILVVINRGNLSKYLEFRTVVNVNIDYPYSKYNDVEERKPKFFRIHPTFNIEKVYHNIALIKLEDPFTFVIKHPPLWIDKLKKPVEGCKIVGYGLLRSQRLKYDGIIRNYTNLTVSNPRIGCNPYGNPHHGGKKMGPFVCFQITERRVCPGDSGVPLLCGGKLIGIATVHEQHAIKIKDQKCHLHEDTWYYYNSVYYELRWIYNMLNGSNALLVKKWFLVALVILLVF